MGKISLNDKQRLPQFQALMEEVCKKSRYSCTFNQLSINQLKTLADDITQSQNDEGEEDPVEIKGGTLRDYRYMCQEKENYELKVSWTRLALLCDYAEYDYNEFTKNTYAKNTAYKLNLLIVSGLWISGSNIQKKELPELIRNRYKGIVEEYKFGSLNVISADSSEDPPATSAQAKQIARDHNADMVIWGDYLNEDIRVNFHLVDEDKYNIDRSLKKKFTFRPLERPSAIYTGDILKDPDFVLFYIFALDAYANSEHDNALLYLNKLNELSPNDSLILLRIAVVYHELQQIDQAAEYYLSTIKNSLVNHDETYYKAVINLSQVHMHQEKYDEGIELLTALKKDIPGYNEEQVSERLLQLYFLQGEITEDGKHAAQLKGLNVNTIKKLTENPSSGNVESFVILKGGEHAMNISTSDLLSDGSLVTTNDKLKSTHGRQELGLMSLSTKKMYKIKLRTTPEAVPKALQLHDAFKILRSNWFDQYAEDYPWLILDLTKVAIPIYDSTADDILILQFENEDELINIELNTDRDKGEFYIGKENITFQKGLIGESDSQKNIQLIAYNPYTEEQTVLYKIKGFVTMSPAYLTDAIKRFQSYFPTATKGMLDVKTIEFIYQTYGVLPEDYLITGNHAGASASH